VFDSNWFQSFLEYFQLTRVFNVSPEKIQIHDLLSESFSSDPSAEDVAIFENDIRLPPLESDAVSDEFSNAVRQKLRLWPGGVVPYVLHDSISTYIAIIHLYTSEINLCYYFFFIFC